MYIVYPKNTMIIKGSIPKPEGSEEDSADRKEGRPPMIVSIMASALP